MVFKGVGVENFFMIELMQISSPFPFDIVKKEAQVVKQN